MTTLYEFVVYLVRCVFVAFSLYSVSVFLFLLFLFFGS